MSQRASASSATPAAAAAMPTARICGRVRVARDQVRELGVEQGTARSAGARAEPAVDRGGRQLHQHACVDERAQQLRVGLDLGIPLGMREHDREAARREPEDDLAQVERPAGVGALEEEDARVAAEPEARERRGVEARRVLDVELAAGEHLDRDARLAGGAVHRLDASSIASTVVG